jgi:transglutaminase-like putative cysteine protease/glutamine cyclotransferase
MRRFSWVVVFYMVLPISISHSAPGDVLSKHQAPGRFCTGLAFDGERLWTADYHTDSLYQIDPGNGAVQATLPSPGFWPTGLAWDGEALWNADRKQSKLFKIDPKTGTILRTLDAPGASPSGLTWDGNTLWVCDDRSNMISKLDLDDGTAIERFQAPASSPQGLTFDGRYLWCSDRILDELYMIDPSNGEVLIVIDSTAPYPRGLAWDGSTLWNVDFESDTIYKLVRHDDQIFSIDNARDTKVTLIHQARAFGQGDFINLETVLALPEDRPHQKIHSKTLSPDRYTLREDQWNQRLAHFDYSSIVHGESIESVLEMDVTLYDIRYYIFPGQCGTVEDIPEDIRRQYTQDGSKYQLTNPWLQSQAKEWVGNETNPYWMARRLFDAVRNTLEYEMVGGWNAAPLVLHRGTGSCSEYTFSFIALCRAVGLPARYVGAIMVRGDDASLDEVFHRWPEVYLPHYGWIPMDPQAGDKNSPRKRALAIGGLSNRALITTQGGGDSEYLGWNYNYHQQYKSDPQVIVQIEAFAEWEPLADEE